MLVAALAGAILALPASARADLQVDRMLPAPLCPTLTIFCGDFTVDGFAGWDGLNGNTSSPDALANYFRIVPATGRVPVGRRFFAARVDAGAVDRGEAGQRTLVYLFPGSNPLANKTLAFEGSEQWYHSALAFPRGFGASPDTTWNWVLEWHNWPDGPCCANLAMTVDTSGRGERLALRVMGGGTPGRPVDRYRNAANNRSVQTRWFTGDRRLRRGHWYDVLVRVRWSWRASRGLVEWWLDGRRVVSVRMPTLFFYGDNDAETDGATPGPGQAYWMVGYYRPDRVGRRIDRRVATVFHNGARRGPTRGSVAF